jgi:spermidine/putrescine transport system permease protein
MASLTVAFSATILSVVMGAALVFASKWWKPRYIFSMFYANIVFPEIIVAIGLLSLFSFCKIPLGYGSLIVGHTLIGLGFVIPIVRARFLELDPWLTEASADLGATPIQTFKKITIPLLMPSLIASSLLVFTLSLDDFFIAFFCSGPSIETLSLYVYARAKESMDPTINVIASCLLMVSSLFIIILSSLKVIDQVIGHE